MPEEGVDLGPQRIRVFISGNSGNKEMVTHQQRIIMVLESLGIDTEVMDIAAPGMDEARDFMRGGAKKKENQRNVLPPQIFNGDTYCGDYDGFDIANEDDHLDEFLGLPKKGSDLKEGGTAVDGQDPTKLEGQPAVNGEPEKSEASKEDIETTTEDSENTRLQNNTDHDDTTGEEIPTENNETITDQEHESISRNSPEITNETHSKQQDQTESETEEDSRQELTEDEMLFQA